MEYNREIIVDWCPHLVRCESRDRLGLVLSEWNSCVVGRSRKGSDRYARSLLSYLSTGEYQEVASSSSEGPQYVQHLLPWSQVHRYVLHSQRPGGAGEPVHLPPLDPRDFASEWGEESDSSYG